MAEFDDLLAISAPSEIIWQVREDANALEIRTLASSLKPALHENLTKDLFSILSEYCSTTGTESEYQSLKIAFDNSLSHGDLSKFPYKNKLFLASALTFAQLRKTQRHTHFFDSVHPAFFWNEMVLHNVNLITEVKRVAKIKLSSEFLSSFIEKTSRYLNGRKRWADIEDELFKNFFFSLFSDTGLRAEMAVRTEPAWERMVCHVIFEHLSDGVEELWVICRMWHPSPLPDPIQLLKWTVRAFDRARQIYESIQDKPFRLRLVPSIYRGIESCNPKSALSFIQELVSLRRSISTFSEYISAIDVSGREAVTNPELNNCYVATSDFKDALQCAAIEGLDLMVHAGDRGNTFAATGKGQFYRGGEACKCLELAEIEDRETYVREHLRFVDDAIETLITVKLESGKAELALYLNHGAILAPSGSFITKDPKQRKKGVPNDIFFAGQAISHPDNLDQINQILKTLRDHAFEIVTCPTVNTNSDVISRYSSHPWPQWLKQGNRVSLSIDDMLWFQSGVTASMEMAKVALTSRCDMQTLLSLFDCRQNEVA